LEHLGASELGQTHSELARALSAPKASLTPILAELRDSGYLVRDEVGRYRLGPEALFRAIKIARRHRPPEELDTQLLAVFAERSYREFRAHGIAIVIWNETDQQLHTLISYSPRIHVNVSLRPGEGISGRVWQDKKPILVEDYRTWEGALAGFRSSEWRSSMAAPFYRCDDAIGVINVRAHDETRVFNQRDLARLAELTQKLSLVLSESIDSKSSNELRAALFDLYR
jgi:Mn-dependent DtxR family transcriptional regulator